MSHDNGSNPMRWDCAKQGCFNVKKRPKIEAFADCLPGRIAMSDIDAIVEIGGNLLLMEWKDHQDLCRGQQILFERLTLLCPATVLIVEGDAEEMTVVSVRFAWQGRISDPFPMDMDGLKAQVTLWSHWAMANSALARLRHAKNTISCQNEDTK